MSEKYEFTVTISTSDEVSERDTAAQLLQWAASGAGHEHIKHITVHHSDMSDNEADRLLEMLDRFDEDDIESAIEAINAIRDDE